METIDISDNPLFCDCHLSDFVKWFYDERATFDRHEYTKCADAYPRRFEKKALFEVSLFDSGHPFVGCT